MVAMGETVEVAAKVSKEESVMNGAGRVGIVKHGGQSRVKGDKEVGHEFAHARCCVFGVHVGLNRMTILVAFVNGVVPPAAVAGGEKPADLLQVGHARIWQWVQ